MIDVAELLSAQGHAHGMPELGRIPYHLGIATSDAPRARDALGELFGCEWTDIVDQNDVHLFDGERTVVHSCAVAHSQLEPFSIELLQGSPGSIWETRRIMEVHHLGFWSTDVEGDIRAMQARGWEIDLTFVDERGSYENFAYMSKPGAIRIEFADMGWRYQAHLDKLHVNTSQIGV